MELKDFIRDTLVQIVEGTVEAQAAVKGRGKIVPNTSLSMGGTAAHVGLLFNQVGIAVSIVEFDVALNETGSTTTKGSIGVFLGAVNLGSGGASAKEIASLTRIKFSLPVSLPVQP